MTLMLTELVNALDGWVFNISFSNRRCVICLAKEVNVLIYETKYTARYTILRFSLWL